MENLPAEGAAGSMETLSRLYTAHGSILFRVAYRLMGNRHDAEDVVHDVFVGLPEAMQRYEERGNLEGWLKRVTVRVALMKLRRQMRRREVALDPAIQEAVATDPGPEVNDEALWVALARLPHPMRAVLVLKKLEGYSHAEIGRFLGISPGMSRLRLTQGLKQLRTMLGE